MSNLAGKTVVLTGASQGLGRALAMRIMTEGARVALVANDDSLPQDLNEIIKKSGSKYYICNIRNQTAVHTTASQIKSDFSNVDVLVNNAGVWTDDELESRDGERTKVALETNVLGHIYFTNAFLSDFKNKNTGHILNVISTSGVSDIPDGNNTNWKTYGATKWAMRGYTNALRGELMQTGVKVTAFFPGGFESNLYENAGREDAHHQPWMMNVNDVAEAIVFCLTRPNDVLVEQMVVSKMWGR